MEDLSFFGKFAFYMIMDTNKAKASYGVGMSIAESLSQQDLTALDLDQVMAGMHAIFSGIEPLMSPEEANIEIQELRFDLYKKTNNKVKMKMLLDSIDPFFESTKYSIERINILLQMNSKDFLKNKIQNAINNYDCYKISYGKTLELEINNNEILKLYIDKSKIDKLINEGYNCVEALKKFYKESEYEILLSIN